MVQAKIVKVLYGSPRTFFNDIMSRQLTSGNSCIKRWNMSVNRPKSIKSTMHNETLRDFIKMVFCETTNNLELSCNCGLGRKGWDRVNCTPHIYPTSLLHILIILYANLKCWPLKHLPLSRLWICHHPITSLQKMRPPYFNKTCPRLTLLNQVFLHLPWIYTLDMHGKKENNTNGIQSKLQPVL